MRYATSIGIDAHKNSNYVFALSVESGEFRSERLRPEPEALVAWIEAQGLPGPVGCVYESGPTGFGLARALSEAGIECTVAAASKLPRRTDRVKTDRLDAEWLARMLAAGSVRPVAVPTPAQEALAALSRYRAGVSRDLASAKQRVSSFLLARGIGYDLTRRRWTRTFRDWAESTARSLPDAQDAFVLRSLYNDVLHLEGRLRDADAQAREVIGADPALAAQVARVSCIHGIAREGAFALCAEAFDFGRFRSGAAFASYIGLVPSEASSGERVSRGGVTKKGNARMRRVLIEAANCVAKGGPASDAMDPSVPEAVRIRARECNRRLARRYRQLVGKGKAPNAAKAAVAREMAEWVWRIATMEAE